LRRKEKKKAELLPENKSNVKENILETALQKIVYQIKVKKIYDLYQIFIQSDKDFSGLLDFEEFCELLRKIEAKLNKEECKAIYKKMDINNDGQLTFQ
jgi:Ca2+-binding EF-hand superfamily protein